jgi:hypothetical protein
VPADVADFEHAAAGGGFANDDDLRLIDCAKGVLEGP